MNILFLQNIWIWKKLLILKYDKIVMIIDINRLIIKFCVNWDTYKVIIIIIKEFGKSMNFKYLLVCLIYPETNEICYYWNLFSL